MIIDENAFRRQIVAACKELGFHVCSVEAHLSAAGIPDLNVYADKRDVWLELKVVKRGEVKLRPTQRKWHRDRYEAGGQSWVLVLDEQRVRVVPGLVAATLDSAVAAWRDADRASNAPDTIHRILTGAGFNVFR